MFFLDKNKTKNEGTFSHCDDNSTLRVIGKGMDAARILQFRDSWTNMSFIKPTEVQLQITTQQTMAKRFTACRVFDMLFQKCSGKGFDMFASAFYLAGTRLRLGEVRKLWSNNKVLIPFIT